MNSYRNFLNLSVALVFMFSIDSNIAFAMGNEHDDQNMEENAQHECFPNKQEISATAKSPHSDLSYNCIPIALSEKEKTKGATTAKSPKKENLKTINRDNSSLKSIWNDDITDQRSTLFPAP